NPPRFSADPHDCRCGPPQGRSGRCRITQGMAFDLQRTLQKVVDKGGSDLHLKVPAPPLMRIQGKLAPVEDEVPFTPPDTERVLREMLTSSERLSEFARDGEIDFSYTVGGLARFRVNAFRQRGS